METSVTDEDGEFKYRGNLKTAMDFMNEINNIAKMTEEIQAYELKIKKLEWIYLLT